MHTGQAAVSKDIKVVALIPSKIVPQLSQEVPESQIFGAVEIQDVRLSGLDMDKFLRSGKSQDL